jgi:hypothetical protein
MQGPTTVISEQYLMLWNLVTNLQLLLLVEGPLSAEDVRIVAADVERVKRGSYSATRVSIRNFVADLGQFALIRWRALREMESVSLRTALVFGSFPLSKEFLI